MLFNWLGCSPGLLEILSHSELIPDAALTLTLTRDKMRFNFNKKNGLHQALNPEAAAYNYSAQTTTLQTAERAKLLESVILMQRA